MDSELLEESKTTQIWGMCKIVIYGQITPASSVKNEIQCVKSTQGKSKSVVDISKNKKKSKLYF